MTELSLFNPSGNVEISRLHADRLPDLSGRTVAFISDDMWQAHRILPLIGRHIADSTPDVTVLPETEFPMGNTQIDSEEMVDALQARGVDAVVVGNAS
jgi:hypothetical protein